MHADGIAIKRPSALTFDVTRELVDDIVVVDGDEIAHAILRALERCKPVVEPAGAAGLAALLSGKIDVNGKKVGIILSGGNINLYLLARIIEVAKVRANVLTIEHDRDSPHLSPGRPEVTITLEIPEMRYIDELIRMLKNAGYHFSKGSSK